MDWLYLSGMLIVWYGNGRQIYKLIQTKSTKSFDIGWVMALLVSFIIRLPRALSSEYWVWGLSYLISITMMAIMAFLVFWYRCRYKGE